MRVLVDVSNRSDEEIPLTEDDISSIVFTAIRKYVESYLGLKVGALFQVSLTMLSEREIYKLNKKVFGRERPTDVIAFPFYEKDDLFKLLQDSRNLEESMDASPPLVLGEVVVCPGVAVQNSHVYGTTLREELTLLIVHGTLHLFGLPDGDEVLERLQKEVVEEWMASDRSRLRMSSSNSEYPSEDSGNYSTGEDDNGE